MRKNILFMSVSLIITVLFIGLAIVPVTAALDTRATDSEVEIASPEIIGEETVQIDGAPSGEPPCDPCRDVITQAVEAGAAYIESHMPVFNIGEWEPLYIYEFILDVRDAFAGGILTIIAEVVIDGLNFVSYVDEIVDTGLVTFFNEWLGNSKHISTAVGLAIIDMTEYLIQICQDLMNGENVQSAPATAPAATTGTTTSGSTSL